MRNKLALYQADWMRVLADVGLGAAAISRAIELADLNGLFDPVKAVLSVPKDAEPPSAFKVVADHFKLNRS